MVITPLLFPTQTGDMLYEKSLPLPTSSPVALSFHTSIGNLDPFC